MALDATRLKNAIVSGIESATGGTLPTEAKNAMGALATAIVDEIQGNGAISVSGTTASSCTAGGATGTCSATGTIS